MALSRVVAVGDGVTRTFVVNFALGYISSTDVTARVGEEVDGTGNPVYRAITWNSPSLASLSGSAPASGVRVVFDRTVPRDELLVNFEDGDIINDYNLNTAQKQAIMLVQEVLDGKISALADNLDLGGFRITNLGEPVNPTDAATRAFVESRLTDNQQAAAATIEAARQADESATAARDYNTSAASHSAASAAFATASADARNEAVTAEKFAREWAIKPIGQLVNDGVNPPNFSALHWAQELEAFVGGTGLPWDMNIVEAYEEGWGSPTPFSPTPDFTNDYERGKY